MQSGFKVNYRRRLCDLPRSSALLPDPLRGEATLLTRQLQAMTRLLSATSPHPQGTECPWEIVEDLSAFRSEALSLATL